MIKILLADDSSFIRLILKKCLNTQGFEIVGEASSGDEAVKLYKELRPDIVILDVVMESNGLDALDQIIKFDKNASIVFYSGAAIPTSIARSIKSGAKSFLAKPLNHKLLYQTIKNVAYTKNLYKEENKLCSNFYLSVVSDTLSDYGILENDIVNIDTNLEPKSDDLVLAEYDKNITLGKYSKEDDLMTVIPGGKCFRTIKNKDLKVLGVIQGFSRFY